MEKSRSATLLLSSILVLATSVIGCSSQSTKLSGFDDDDDVFFMANKNNNNDADKTEPLKKASHQKLPEPVKKAEAKPVEEEQIYIAEESFEPYPEELIISEEQMHWNGQVINAGQIAFEAFSRPELIFDSGDTWDRVTHSMMLGGFAGHPRVQKFIKSYMENPNSIETIARRSATYIHMVVAEIQRRGLPGELALLPFVESAYKPKAFSRSKAAGLWQFIPTTGASYGLKQTSDYDGRLDPFAATGAALDYLEQLVREFNGDWLLALASYNAGQNRVHGIIRRHVARGGTPNYWELDLPQETMEYVPRLLAYREIILNSGYFGINLPLVPNQARLAQVRINKSVNLREAARLAGLQENILVDLNPCFKKGITTPRYSNRIITPREHTERLAAVIQSMTTPYGNYAHNTKRRAVPHMQRVNFQPVQQQHTVRPGETLYRISKRYGISVQKLMRDNGLRSTNVPAGRRLIIS